MSIAEIRTQEKHQLPKILAGGIGFSLLIHLLAAIAFNYLPMPIPEEVVEITMIDASELPVETQPEPRPTVSIAASPTVLSPTPPPAPLITSPLPAPPVIKSAIEPITPQTSTPLINPTVRVSPTKIAKKSINRTAKIQRSPRSQLSFTKRVSPAIEQPLINNDIPSAPLMPPTTPPVARSILKKPGKTLDQPTAQGSINPISLDQTSTNEKDNPSISPSTASASPAPKLIDRLDQQDDLDVLSTATANDSPPVFNQLVRPPSMSGKKNAVPLIANNSNLQNSSNLKSRSSKPFGQSQNTGGVTASKNQKGSPPANRIPGKGLSIKGSNSVASNVAGSSQETGQQAGHGRTGEVAKSGNRSAPAGMTLRCAPDSNCKPPYPDEAQGAQGVTVLEILLADDGRVSNSQVAKSSGNNLFDRAAVEAAPTMRFVLPPGRQRKFRVAIKFIPEAG